MQQEMQAVEALLERFQKQGLSGTGERLHSSQALKLDLKKMDGFGRGNIRVGALLSLC